MKFILFLAAVSIIWMYVGVNDFILPVPYCISECLQKVVQQYAYIRGYISNLVIRSFTMFGMLDEGIGDESPHMRKHTVSTKKEDYLRRIHFVAVFSALTAVVPVPGMTYIVDLLIIAEETYFYMGEFGLSAVTDIRKVFSQVFVDYMILFVIKTLAMGCLRYMLPIIGILVDFVLSYILYRCILETILHTLAEEALLK